MKRQKTAVALSASVPWGSNQSEILYTVRERVLWIHFVFDRPELSQFKGSSGDVLTCHNTAFLDIQQKGQTAGAFGFTAVPE